jgi:hypothetical protein
VGGCRCWWARVGAQRLVDRQLGRYVDRQTGIYIDRLKNMQIDM